MKKLKLNIQMFASTNKTTYYELPQFVGTDKPTWLGDFNEAMADIDAGMHENATDISSIETIAQNASTSASQASQDVLNLTGRVNTLSSDVSSVTQTANNAQQTATSALNTANTANSKIGDLTELETIDKSNTVSAINELKQIAENFNLSIFETPSNVTTSNGTLSTNSLSVAKNTDGSLAKVYGTLGISSITATSVTISFQTSLRPEAQITINNAVFFRQYSTADYMKMVPNYTDLVIGTNGLASCNILLYTGYTNADLYLLPFLYFIKDFGDTPTPQSN